MGEMAAAFRFAASRLRSICGGSAPPAVAFRSQAAPASDMGGLAGESFETLQADLAGVVVPPDSRVDQPASGAHLFPVPSEARSAHCNSARPS
jgi:hypothetical protein